MSKTTAPAPCWVVRDADGQSWDDEFDQHHATREDAEAAARDVEDDMEGDPTPEEYAAMIGESHGPEAEARALRLERARFDRATSLHPVQIAAPCYTITCDGMDSERDDCEAEPEGEYGGHLHFRPGDEFSPGDYDWKEVDGKYFCDDCRVAAICGECEELSGDGSLDRDGMCPTCWAKDQVAPGPGQTAIEGIPL